MTEQHHTLTITVRLDNAALRYGEEATYAESGLVMTAVRRAMTDADELRPGDSGRISDANGQPIGQWQVDATPVHTRAVQLSPFDAFPGDEDEWTPR